MNPDSTLRYIVAIHFIFTSMVNMAEWLPFGYTLNQIALIVLGIWAIIQSESVIHVELLMLMKFFTVVLDSIAIGMYFQMGKDHYALISHKSYFNLSAVFAFALLFMKLPMLILLNIIRRNRLGDTAALPHFTPWGNNDAPVGTGVDQKQANTYIPIPE